MFHSKLLEQLRCSGLGPEDLPNGLLEAISFAYEEQDAKQAAALQHRSLLSMLIENTSELICSLDGQYRVTMYNSAFKSTVEQLLGIKVRFGSTLQELLDPGKHAVLLEEFSRAFRGERFTSVHTVNRNGQLQWYSVAYHPVLENGRAAGMTCYAQNITEQKQAELSLMESEARYRSVVDNVKEVVFQTDSDGLWTFLNRSWTEVTGFAVEESLGTLFLDYVHPDDRDRNNRLFLPLIERKKDYCRHEVRYVTKEGGYRCIEVFARLTVNDRDEIVGTSGTLTDITFRKQMEESLIRSKEEAERANRTKTDFVSRISHELRTPLNAILGFAQLLELEQDPPLTTVQSEKVTEIIHAGEHLTELINDVLELSRIEAGKLELDLETVELGPVLKECLSYLHPSASRKRVKLEPFTPDPGMKVLADRVRIKQVLLNLLSNAVKYNRENGSIAVNCVLDERFCHMRIADTGLGIPADDLERLFEPYTQFHKKNGIEGSGMGLSITRQLLEMMGGGISAESVEGAGTTFHLRIPRAEAVEAAGAAG